MHVTTLTRRGLIGAAAAAAALGTAQPALASSAGAVYALSNETQNAVITFDRAADGSLTQRGATLTGGAGAGAGLGTQTDVNWLKVSVDPRSREVFTTSRRSFRRTGRRSPRRRSDSSGRPAEPRSRAS